MASSNLTDLPTELLLKIFHHLESQDILKTGIVCRRLALIATTVYLARKGTLDPETSCSIRPTWRGHSDEVTALTFNFSLVHIKQFICNFTAEPQSQKISKAPQTSVLTWNIRRVTKLISRLSSIGTVTIALYPRTRSFIQPDVKREFITAIFELLDTILQKSCTSLQILHPDPMALNTNYKFEYLRLGLLHPNPMAFNTKYMFEPLGTTIALAWQGIKLFLVRCILFKTAEDRYLQGMRWRYRKLSSRNPIPLLKPPILLPSRLTNFDLSSDFLLLPPFAPWVFGVLKCSPISSLSLSLPRTILAEEFRHYIFPRIVDAVPGLEEIRFAFFYRDSLSVVVENLSIFPRLRKVTFGAHSPHDFNLLPISWSSRKWSSRKFDLDHLNSFTGSLDQAVYLFRQPISYRNLEVINIVYSIVFRASDPNLLDMFDQEALSTKFSSLDRRLSEMDVKPLITLCLLSHSAAFRHQIPQNELESFQRLTRVSRLNIELPWFNGHENEILASQAGYALSCLGLFPEVKSLSLISRQPAPTASSKEARRLTTMAAIHMDHPGIVSFDIAYDLPEVHHGHWRNAIDNLNRHKPSESCVCSNF